MALHFLTLIPIECSVAFLSFDSQRTQHFLNPYCKLPFLLMLMEAGFYYLNPENHH